MSSDFWGPEEYDQEAQRLYDRGEYEAALELLWEGVTLYPESTDLHVSLGYTQLAREAYGWARRAFERALELEPDHEEALVGWGDAALKLGERSRALLAFEKVRELGFGDDTGLMLAVARALYREELHERAVSYYRRAARRPEARAELGYALYQLGREEEAVAALEEALEEDPELHEARAFLGNLLYDRGDYEAALDRFLEVPPGEVWDPLAVWRAVELLRGYRGLGPDDAALEPYLEQLERLSSDPSPEERILAEVEAAEAGRPAERDRQQLDLFVLETGAPRAHDPTVHTVRARDGRVYTGDWLSIVRALRDDSSDPTVTVSEFMEEAARLVRSLTGLQVPDDDPEAFLKASARAGIFRIEE